MRKKKAIELIDDLVSNWSVSGPSLIAFQVRAVSVVKELFGESSPEYDFISKFDFDKPSPSMTRKETDDQQSLVYDNLLIVEQFFEDCKLTIKRRGVRPKHLFVFNRQWVERNPVIFEFIKWAIPVISAWAFGYFIQK